METIDSCHRWKTDRKSRRPRQQVAKAFSCPAGDLCKGGAPMLYTMHWQPTPFNYSFLSASFLLPPAVQPFQQKPPANIGMAPDPAQPALEELSLVGQIRRFLL